MIVAPEPKNMIPALLFIVVAAALSAYATYYVNERLKAKK
jgi:hypothetical protein